MNLCDDGFHNKKDICFIIRWTIRIHRLLMKNPELRLSESLWQWLVHYTTIGHCLLSDVRLIQDLVWCFGSWLYFQLQVVIMLTSRYYRFYFWDQPAQMFLRLQYTSSTQKVPRSIPNAITNPQNKNNKKYDN